MSFDEGSLISPSAVDAAYRCSGVCNRQCSPESCPSLTAQCTDRCVVVACSDPHDDDDDQDVCGDIMCDDQNCTDPTDCHGIYEFVSLTLFFFNTSSRLFFAPSGPNPPDVFECLPWFS